MQAHRFLPFCALFAVNVSCFEASLCISDAFDSSELSSDGRRFQPFIRGLGFASTSNLEDVPCDEQK